MKVTKEENAPREVQLNVELDPDDIEPYLDRAYRRLVNRVQIPGFRRGKAPRAILENHVGREALVRENLDFILQESLDKAIEDESLETFGEPDVELLEIDPLSFKAVMALEPVIELGDFRSLRLEPEPVEVTEEQVGEALEHMRLEAAPWEPADGPVKFDDLVTLDVDGTIEGNVVADDRGVDFIPREDNPLPFPGFSIHLEGMKKDDSKEFVLGVPEDYPDSSLVGKECRFKIMVLEVKRKVLAELDDEFAKGVGDGYESLDALRSSVLESLTAQVKRVAERALQEKSLQEVLKEASVEVSDLTTNREIDHLMEEQNRALQGRRMDMDTYLRDAGKSREELRNELRPVAVERLTRFLVMRELAQEEGIEVSSEDIDSEIDVLTSGSGQSQESLRQSLSTEDARSSIGNAILTRTVLERLAGIARGEFETVSMESEDDEPSVRSPEDSVIEQYAAEGQSGVDETPGPTPQDEEAGESEREGGSASDR